MIEAPATGTVTYWLPLITAVIGFVSGGFTEWLRDRRAYRREKEVRNATRRDAQLERRNEFQRQTLLQLQDAAMNLMKTAGLAHVFDMKRWNKQKVWHVEPYPEDLNEENRAANGQTAMLGVRIHDEKVRSVLTRLKGECSSVMGARTPDVSKEGIDEAGALFVMLNEQIGFVLRKMDEVERSDG